MKITESEAIFLYNKQKLQTIPPVNGVVAVPHSSNWTQAQLEVFQKLVFSMGLKTGMTHYIYTEGDRYQTDILEAILKFKPRIVLNFSHEITELKTAKVEEINYCVCVKLPDLALIESDLDCKRAVWNILKPLALA